jgi:hypothetical protein
MMTAARHWYSHGYRVSIADELDRALAVIERGLLVPRPVPLSVA